MAEPAPTAAATEPPAAPEAPDQADANIEVYERTFRKCMAAAERILEDEGMPGISDRKVDVATALFQQFYADQGSANNFQRQTQAVMDGVQRVLEGRR